MILKDYLRGLNSRVAETAIGIRSYSKYLKKQATKAMEYLYSEVPGSISLSLPHLVQKVVDGITIIQPIEGIEEVVTVNLSNIDLGIINDFDIVPVITKQGTEYQQPVTYGEVVGKISSSVQMMLAEAEMLDACLEQDIAKTLDVSGILNRVRSVLPNASDETLSFVSDSLSGMSNPLNVCYNLLSGNLSSLSHDQYKEDNELILVSSTPYTGNPCQSAFQMIGEDIANIFDVAWNGVLEIGSWIGGILGNLFSFISKMLLPAEAFTYYEKVGDAHNGLFDIPYLQFSMTLSVAQNVMWDSGNVGALHATELIPGPYTDSSWNEWPNYCMKSTFSNFKEAIASRFLTDDGLGFNSNIEIPTPYGIVRYTFQPLYGNTTNDERPLIDRIDYDGSKLIVQAYVYDVNVTDLDDSQIMDKLTEMAWANATFLTQGRAVIPYAYSDVLNSYLSAPLDQTRVLNMATTVASTLLNGINLDSTQSNPFARWALIKGQSGDINDTGFNDVNQLNLYGRFTLSVHIGALLSFATTGQDDDIGKLYGNFTTYSTTATDSGDGSLISFDNVEGSTVSLFPLIEQDTLWSPFLSNYTSPINLHYQTTDEQAKDIKKAIYRGAAVVGAIFAVTTIKLVKQSINRKKALATQLKREAASKFLKSNSPADKVALDKAIRKDNWYNNINTMCGSLNVPKSDSNIQQEILNLLK